MKIMLETIPGGTIGRDYRRASLKIGRLTISLNRWTISIGREQTANTRHFLIVIGWATWNQPGVRASATFCAWETGLDNFPITYDALCLLARPLPCGKRRLVVAIDNRAKYERLAA